MTVKHYNNDMKCINCCNFVALCSYIKCSNQYCKKLLKIVSTNNITQ